MKEVIQEAVKLLEEGQPCVLATVVRTKGSTPQKSGAMLLVRDDGSGLGTLGGGCVEGDIWFAAQEILRNHGGPEFKDYFLNEDIAARDGLVCGGTMYFYLEPFWEAGDFAEVGQELLDAYNGGEPVALATVVNVPPGAPGLGAKLLLRTGGSGGRHSGRARTWTSGRQTCAARLPTWAISRASSRTRGSRSSSRGSRPRPRW